MAKQPKSSNFFIVLGVLIFQLVLTQVILFLVSLIAGGTYLSLQESKILFAIVLGLAFASGTFLAGWVALRLHWLDVSPRLAARAAGTILGAFIPLLLAVLLTPTLDQSNLFYSLSILCAVIGFHVPTWFKSA